MPAFSLRSALRYSLYLVISLGLLACGGGSGGDGNTFSDPANAEGVAEEDQIQITVETQNIQSGQLSNAVNALEPLAINILLKNGKDRPITESIVSITTSVGTLSSETGDTLTDANGQVTAELSVFDELPGTAGTLTISHLEETLDVFFTIEKAPVSVGSIQNGVFSEGVVGVLAPVISAAGETVLSITVRDAQGTALGREFPPVFSSDCAQGTPPLASFGRVTYTQEGAATVNYLAEGCTGTDIIDVEIEGLVGHTAQGQVDVLPLAATSIVYTSADNPTLGLLGSQSTSLPDSTLLTFTVADPNGEPANRVEVQFSLSTTLGGIALATNSALTNAEGEAQVRLSSGNIPTVVRVTATIEFDSMTVAALSENIRISSGRPDQNSFSIAADILNPGGDSNDGITSTISASAADRFNGPVPDDSTIFFRTEYGRIDASCATSNGVCTVEWRSQDPRQPSFSSFTDDDGNPAFLRTIQNTNCPTPGAGRGVPCPDFLGHPIGGRTTIIAYTAGDEDFIDANANGVYDSDEPFVDLPEAFLDYNEDGAFGNSTTNGSCHPNCPEAGGEEELFIDTNNDGLYTSGNGIYNGSLCSEQAITSGECLPSTVTVRDSIVLLMSGSEPYGAFYNGATSGTSALKSISVSSVDRSFLFYASDAYNGKLPNGTTVDVESSDCPLTGTTNFTVSNSNSTGPSVFQLTVSGGTSIDTITGTISANVSVPSSAGGSGAISFNLPCSIDACGVQPAPTFCTMSP